MKYLHKYVHSFALGSPFLQLPASPEQVVAGKVLLRLARSLVCLTSCLSQAGREFIALVLPPFSVQPVFVAKAGCISNSGRSACFSWLPAAVSGLRPKNSSSFAFLHMQQEQVRKLPTQAPAKFFCRWTLQHVTARYLVSAVAIAGNVCIAQGRECAWQPWAARRFWSAHIQPT